MPAIEPRPHIALIVLDTHRLDRLGCYGHRRGATPNLDAFARQATLFEQAIAPAQWTIPSHASMFTGEPPSTHMTLQSNDVLDPRFKTLAQRLRDDGYRTAAFCNNPLVGVLSNGLKRGFQTFYNYSGAVPSVPARPARRMLSPFSKAWEQYTQLMRKISYPIQNAFGNSTHMFLAALNPLVVPLWTSLAHFKGNTVRSVHDAVQFVHQHMACAGSPPHFLFVNVMETHLPFNAPEPFIRTFAPYLREERAAHEFMHSFNRQALHWLTPLQKPFSDLEMSTLSDMYDAEVAYQDHLLAELFEALEQLARRADTAVIVVSDHGEMLGEHGAMGHGFGVYQELIHVPLMIQLPGQKTGRRMAGPVSATRLFHTVLDIAGVETYQTDYSPATDVKSQSLIREVRDCGRPQSAIVSEAYAPDFALRIMERHKPELIDRLNSRATRWAVYENRFKLVYVEDSHSELFDLDHDPSETQPLGWQDERMGRLLTHLESFVEKAAARRPAGKRRAKINLDDELVRQRLRGLGYIE